MDWHGKSIRMGAWAIALAVALRLWTAGAFETVYATLASPSVGSFLIYLETGRVVKPLPESPTEPSVSPTQPPATAPPTLPCFSADEEDLIRVWGTGGSVDPGEFLELPLEMDLSGETPTVLILHTHATESYTQAEGDLYTESSPYRTLDPEHNMVAVGAYLASLLEAEGIQVIHDTTIYDYPEYNGAYYRSEDAIEAYLEEYPGLFLVLDLHRDSAAKADGGELDTSATAFGQESAQLMFLMGTDYGTWRENMNLAVKLTALLEREHPGITRGILTRGGDYNQYLTPGTLLVEVGGAGNTQAEAMMAVRALAEAIVTLRHGAE